MFQKDFLRNLKTISKFNSKNIQMNRMTDKPENMTRVLLTDDEGITLQFAFYKDGMYKVDGTDYWQQPQSFGGWMSIKELKFKIM